MGNAIARRKEQLLEHTTVGQSLFSEPEAREEISARIYQLPAPRLARITGVTPQGARHWIEGDRCPNLASTINLARALPSVREWLAERSHYSRPAHAGSLDEVIRALAAIASRNDAEGVLALQILAAAAELRKPRADGQPKDISAEDAARTAMRFRFP